MRIAPAIAALISVLFVSGCVWAADPAYYARQADWLQTLLASRETLAKTERESRENTARIFITDIIRGGEPAKTMGVDVSGWKELNLYVIGAPDVVYGAATWADAKLIDTSGRATYITQIKGLKVVEGQHEIDRNLHSGVSGPLKIAGKPFTHGLHVYPNSISKVVIPLDRPYTRFEAMLGIDDWVGPHGAVRFIVTDASGAARCDLWELLARDFAEDLPRRQMKWTREDLILEADWKDFAELAKRYSAACYRIPAIAQAARSAAASVREKAELARVVDLYYRSRTLDAALARARSSNFRPLRMAIADLAETFGDRYPRGREFAGRAVQLEIELSKALASIPRTLADYEKIEQLVGAFDSLQREALLANPLMNFDRLLLIERKPNGDPRMPIGTGFGLGEFIGLPRQTSKHDPDIDNYYMWENRIAVLSPVRPDGNLTTVYQSEGKKLIIDMNLHWNADRLLFSMPGNFKKWQIYEIGTDGAGLRQITPGDQPEVHSYNPCYLPNGKIAFLSTACLQGVPCNAGVIVGMLYTMDADGKNIRQICFEQDHDYYPTVTNDGRILYLRWDYTDTPHVWNRMLFTCNPDGTGQMEYYKANGYWPNAIFYAKAIPNEPTKVVGIVTGHHVGRIGELTIFDPAKSRFEADGVVQQIPGYGKKVEPKIQDKLTEHSWPKFLHPWPLSDKYFIVSCKPTPDSLWGIYLVDVFDNMTLLKEVEGQTLTEPIPLVNRPVPPVIPEKTKPNTNDAYVYMSDVYTGPSMKGIPRGTVKKLRVFTYHFGYQRIAGIDHRVGADGPWEVKRVLGTVRVEADGSALFKIPAKTPLSVQPLDAEGKAIQLMRSWMTAQPGETVSCVGCHDNRGAAPIQKDTIALKRPIQEIQPWRDVARGFSFKREVQPVLDKYCVSCHDGKHVARASTASTPSDMGKMPMPRDVARASSPWANGTPIVDLRGDQNAWICYRGGDPVGQIIRDTPPAQLVGKFGGIFQPSYIALRRFVRVGGLESDLHLLPPMEFYADTSELFQMLRKGHHGVTLDEDAWDRLQTWVDLNAPCHGTWSEFVKISANQRQRRQELQKLYGGVACDPEEYAEEPAPKVQPLEPSLEPVSTAAPLKLEGWPFDAAEAQRRQTAGGPSSRTFDLGNGVRLDLMRIPAGKFVMGDVNGFADERPQAIVNIDKPFWMGKFEVTNEQFRLFDPAHDSRFEHRSSWIFSEEYLGWPLNLPKQPVVRVSWNEAIAYCDWLSQKTGKRFAIPTEAQWEYACRAGSDSPLSFGDTDTDFSPFANLADYSIRNLAYEGWRPKSPDIAPRDDRFNDGHLVTADVGSYKPNAWGLFDMHGNAAEWTRSLYRPYPYRDDDRNGPSAAGKRVVRGGSWFDRPQRARSGFRLPYQSYQKVFNVGFRVVCEE